MKASVFCVSVVGRVKQVRGVTCNAPNWTVSPIATSKLMMRPVILSRPENNADLLTMRCGGGSVMTSSPGCGDVSAGWPRGPRGAGPRFGVRLVGAAPGGGPNGARGAGSSAAPDGGGGSGARGAGSN